MSQGQNDGSLKQLWLGIGIALGIYLLGIILLVASSSLILPYMLLAGVALIVFPIVAFSMGKKRLGQGALIGLGLNILLFSACAGILISNLGG
ncbi:hypothetical protein [Neobacillus cucumis]|uniref:hypothetical protein n=1 Tax=Neobacillus cucumis TaxID=1740721 RepID=UPI0028530834|nr:hypothetical protein [Neobacillus cucumis]MDR4946432.1 hypothetical protein [Neobacillus cucumis]